MMTLVETLVIASRFQKALKKKEAIKKKIKRRKKEASFAPWILIVQMNLNNMVRVLSKTY